MVIDLCLKQTPTYDVISLSVAFKKLWESPKKCKAGLFLAAAQQGSQKSQYICRRE